MIRRTGVLAIAVLFFSGLSAQASKEIKVSDWGNAKVKPNSSVAPDETIDELAQEFRVSANAADIARMNRKPATDQRGRVLKKNAGDENLLSDELRKFEFGDDKTPGLFSLKSPGDLDRLFARYKVSSQKSLDADQWFLGKDSSNSQYNVDPDVQFVVNRLSPLAAFRGFLWRMAPFTHQSIMTHTMLLNLVRSFGENSMLFFPDTQWQVYMEFLSTPSGEQVRQGTRACTFTSGGKAKQVKIAKAQFCYENEMVDFFRAEVMPVLDQAIRRFGQMPTTHMIKSPGGSLVEENIYFDNRVRFGGKGWSNPGSEAYDPVDRFKEIGTAEKLLAMARFARRNAVIAQLVAYNWNGNIALRRELGKRMGWGSAIDSLDPDPFSLEGLTRQDRVSLAKEFASKGTFRAFPENNGKDSADVWMPIAYYYLSQYANNVQKAWGIIKAEFNNREDDFLLDPDLFYGRQDQIERGIQNLKTMFPFDRDASGNPIPCQAGTVPGAISGENIQINMCGFFHHPPKTVTDLMPTQFAVHEDIEKMRIPAGLTLVTNPGVSTVIVISQKDKDLAQRRLADLAKKRESERQGTWIGNAETAISVLEERRNRKNGEADTGVDAASYEWRNYLWGRAIGWNPGTYGTLFPGVANPSDVMHRQEVLAEVRGGRAVLNSLAIFVK
jgi:hypothetical protein